MSPRHNTVTEKDEQRAVVGLFRAVGATVYSMSQYRASHVAIGLPDLYVMHAPRGLAWWFECKRYEGMWRRDGEAVAYNPFDRSTWQAKPLAPPQAVFADHCCAVGIRHFWGGLREAEEALVELGLAVRAGNLGILLNPVARGGEVAA